MKVWRIANRHRLGLEGEGARLYGGRWNKPGIAVIYTSSTLSLAVLECLVHLNPSKIPDDLVYVVADVPDSVTITSVDIATLPAGWNAMTLQPVTQTIGTQWAEAAQSAILQVPSGVIHQESNYVLNPHHAEFAAISWSLPVPFSFDPRLISRASPAK
ncbi:MAG: RES family NAD+ phosphorylase [Nitrospirota bacterium]